MPIVPWVVLTPRADSPPLGMIAGAVVATSSQQRQQESELDVTCAICHDKLLDPVTTPCGHNYCKLCLNRWLRRSHKCPLDNAVLPKVEFKVNHMLQSLVWANNTPAELQARPPTSRPMPASPPPMAAFSGQGASIAVLCCIAAPQPECWSAVDVSSTRFTCLWRLRSRVIDATHSMFYVCYTCGNTYAYHVVRCERCSHAARLSRVFRRLNCGHSTPTAEATHRRALLPTRLQTSPQPVGETVGEVVGDSTLCASPVAMCPFSSLPPCIPHTSGLSCLHVHRLAHSQWARRWARW